MNTGRPGDIDPRWKRRGQMADMVVSAATANINARRRVRAGVPPEQAATQATMATMIAGTMGIVGLIVFLPSVINMFGGDTPSRIAFGLIAAYAWFTMRGSWIFIRIVPHRMTPWQQFHSNLWFQLLCYLGILVVVPFILLGVEPILR
jgi:hypothetical protein